MVDVVRSVNLLGGDVLTTYLCQPCEQGKDGGEGNPELLLPACLCLGFFGGAPEGSAAFFAAAFAAVFGAVAFAAGFAAAFAGACFGGHGLFCVVYLDDEGSVCMEEGV